MSDSSRTPLNHLARIVRQPFVAAIVAVRQFLVLETEQMQDRGMQVVDVNFVVFGPQPDGVGAPMTCPPLTPPPASHM